MMPVSLIHLRDSRILIGAVAIIIVIMLAIGAVAPAAMLTEGSLLTDEQMESLIPSAREQYEKADHFLDRGNYSVALRYLSKAFELQDDHAEMNFLLSQVATYRARQTFGKESMDNFELAEKALRANLRIKKLTFNNRQRTEKKLESIQDERDKVAERDNKRTEIGRQFIREQLVYRGVDLTPKQDKEETKGATSSASAPVPAPPAVTISPFMAPTAPGNADSK